MTKRAAVGEIINGSQAALLDLMRASPGSLSMQDLHVGAGICRSFASRLLLELRELELAEVAVAGELPIPRANKNGRTALLYTITRAGSRALARYEHKQAEDAKVVVAPPTFNTAGQPYVPTRRAYYRNEGNRHIQSRGFPC